jgi:predicted methyltransferase
MTRGMNMTTATFLRAAWLAVLSLTLAACASQGGARGTATKRWTESTLTTALAAPSRPPADKDRDADRKPAELMTFLGVEPGMTALDAVAVGGYMTEVLAIAVGPNGKVYSQNPPAVYQLQGGMYVKPVDERHANKRLPNTVRVDADLPASAQIPPGGVDVALTAQNFHAMLASNTLWLVASGRLADGWCGER